MDRFDSRNQLASGARLVHISQSTRTQGFLHYFKRIVLAQEDYFGVGGDLPDLPGGFDSIQAREAEIQKHQIRFQFLGLLNCD